MRAGLLFSEATRVEMLRRLHLIRADDRREATTRIAVAIVVAWLPLVAISLASGDRAAMSSFFTDAAVHARFLLAVPLFIAADYVVLPHFDSMAQYFAATNLVPPSKMAEYEVLLARSRRLTDGHWTSIVRRSFLDSLERAAHESDGGGVLVYCKAHPERTSLRLGEVDGYVAPPR